MTILTEAKEVLDPLCHTSPDEFRRIIKELIERIERNEQSQRASKESARDPFAKENYLNCVHTAPWDLQTR
jgi:hypothetical protein